MSTQAITLPLTVPDAILARRSIRKYKATAIPAEDLNRILELTRLAPSSANTQPWRFVVVQDPALQAELQRHAYNQAQVGAAPALIVLYTDAKDAVAVVDELIHPGVPDERRPGTRDMIVRLLEGKPELERQVFTAFQAGIALGFLVLAAQSLGYSTSVMGGFDPQKFGEILELPAGTQIPAIVALGIADEPGFSAHRLSVERLTRFVR